MQDVADFLAAHPPFDALDPADVERLAAAAEVEFHPAGAEIFHQGAGPVAHLWMVRSGAVEIVHDDRVLDLLGPGELFGQASMISGLPAGFEARAAQDAVCYRIPVGVLRPLLARPDVLRAVADSMFPRTGADPPLSRVDALIRTPPLLCRGDEPIREAARRMTDRGVSAVVVRMASSLDRSPSTSCASRSAALDGVRTRATTSSPRSRNLRTKCLPMKPVPPVTKAFTRGHSNRPAAGPTLVPRG